MVQGNGFTASRVHFGIVITDDDDYPINSTDDFYIAFDRNLPSTTCHLPTNQSPIRTGDSLHIAHQNFVNQMMNPGEDASEAEQVAAGMVRKAALMLQEYYYTFNPEDSVSTQRNIRIYNPAAKHFAMQTITVISIEHEYWNAGTTVIDKRDAYIVHRDLLRAIRFLICYSYRHIILEDYVNISSSIGSGPNEISKQTQANEIDALVDRIMYPSFDDEPGSVVNRAGEDMRYFANTPKVTPFFLLVNIWEGYQSPPKYDCDGLPDGNHYQYDIGILDYLNQNGQNLSGYASEVRLNYLAHPADPGAQHPTYPLGTISFVGTAYNDLSHLSKHHKHRIIGDMDSEWDVEVFQGNGNVWAEFESKSANYEVYNIQGQLISRGALLSGEMIPLKSSGSGLYLIKFFSTKGQVVKKVLVL